MLTGNGTPRAAASRAPEGAGIALQSEQQR